VAHIVIVWIFFYFYSFPGQGADPAANRDIRYEDIYSWYEYSRRQEVNRRQQMKVYHITKIAHSMPGHV